MKPICGGPLFEKEIRQNLGTMIILCLVPMLFLGARWLMAWPGARPDETDYRRLFYWMAFAMAAALGSSFLADENGTRTANFLLRLPLSRRRIFWVKALSHGVLFAAGCLIVGMVLWTFSVRCELLPPNRDRWTLPELYTAGVQMLLSYWLAIACSVLLDRAISAFLAAAAATALLVAAVLFAAQRAMEWLAYTPTPDPREVQWLIGVLLTCLLPVAGAGAWRLFLRKEGR